jgi:hypothetical protein
MLQGPCDFRSTKMSRLATGPFQLRLAVTPESLSLVVSHSQPISTVRCVVARHQRGNARPTPTAKTRSRPRLDSQSGPLAQSVGMLTAYRKRAAAFQPRGSSYVPRTEIGMRPNDTSRVSVPFSAPPTG